MKIIISHFIARMFKEAILTFICFVLFVQGKPNLSFLEGTEKLVPAIKIIRNGTNFTVTCVIEDLKTKKKTFDLIFWTNGDLRRKHGEVNPITLSKPGTYYCISEKYKLVKRLHLIVRDEHDFVRRKRSQYQFGNQQQQQNFGSQYHLGIPGRAHTDIPPLNLPDPIRDLLDGGSKPASNNYNNNHHHGIVDEYLSNSRGTFITNNNIVYEPNQNTDYREMLDDFPDPDTNLQSNSKYPPPVFEHKDGFNVIYFFAIVLAFVVISLLIYCMSKKRSEPVSNDTVNTNDNINNTNNQTQYCSHVFCARYRSTNPDASAEIRCFLAVLNSSDMPVSRIRTGDDGGVTILTSLITNDSTDSNRARPYSDSPPAYGISTRSSPLHSREDVPNESDLPPPSYHQAVANMNLEPPPDFDSTVNQTLLSTTATTSLPNVTRTRAPLIRARAVDPDNI